MKHLIAFFIFSFCVIALNAQHKTISGKVTSDKGTALDGANVVIENTKFGTVADADGEFTLKADVSGGDWIAVSYIGFEKYRVRISEITGFLSVRLRNKILASQTVLIQSSIGEKGVTPATFEKIEREQISERYVNQDVPELLSYLPSTTYYSEGGAGVGYNYLSIRGFDQRRISVSINGIPQNDPEDHNVYWVDFPDLIESTEMIQVQRGAGSGVVGYPSVGGSINIITSPFSNEQKIEFSSAAGSYNTRKYTASFSSGLINKKYSIYAKVSQLLSSGYRERNWVNFRSYHLSAVRYDEKLTTQINLFGGPIEDGLVYMGLPKFAVKNKNLRKANYSWWSASNGSYAYSADRRPDEVESFSQPHFELLNEYKLNDNVVLNSALFLVLGKGYFDYDGSWAPYSYFRITPENGFPVVGDPSNKYFPALLIRAWVNNTQWGWIPRLSIKHDGGQLIVGGQFRLHNSKHWGEINHAAELPATAGKYYQYYAYKGAKDIANIYFNESYRFNDKINFLVEAQLAYHKYHLYDEKFIGTDFEVTGLNFNPRIGINYKFNDAASGYLTFARVTREPRLKNYYDAAEASDGYTKPQFGLLSNGQYDFENPLVKPETMNSIDAGVNLKSKNYELTANLFFMSFNDEIVKKGQLDRFGQPVTGNVDKTIHSGVELSGKITANENFDVVLNGSFSSNYISEGKYYINGANFIDLKDNRISGFPDLTFNAVASYRREGFLLQFFAKYVGGFYSDNYDENLSAYLTNFPGFVGYHDNKVEGYFVSNLAGAYNFGLEPYFKNVKIFFTINNIFDNLYAAYAVGGEFFPAAERNFLAGIKLGL